MSEKKRKYYRHCVMCGKRFEQKHGAHIRDFMGIDGWFCNECIERRDKEHPEWFEEEW